MSQSSSDGNARDPAKRRETLAPEAVSGRVTFDPRGNAVWEFRTVEGHFSSNASTELVRSLDAPTLSLEQTALLRRTEEAAAARPEYAGGGFNPYDSARRHGPGNSTPDHPQLVLPPVKPVVTQSRKRSGLLQRLWPWHRQHGR